MLYCERYGQWKIAVKSISKHTGFKKYIYESLRQEIKHKRKAYKKVQSIETSYLKHWKES